MKTQIALLVLLAFNVTLYAQTRPQTPIVSKPAPSKTTEPTAEQIAARERARLDSIGKVQALAREIARQMIAEDSIGKARLAAAEAPKTVAEQTVVVNPQQPETMHRREAESPKGIIAIGPSAQFNGKLETTLIGGSIGLGYAAGRKVGILLAADYQAGNHTAVYEHWQTFLSESYNTSSITLRPEFRFYPKRSFEGFFIGVNGTLMSYKAGGFTNSKLVIENETGVGGGLVLGVNVAASSRLNFEFGLSGGVLSGARHEVIVGSGALRIGYAF